MKKRLSTSLSLLLALILLVSSIPFAFAADPVLIATAEDFIKFTNGDASADAVLDADIDLGEWTTAFTDGYSGTFDGNGHSITYTITDATANFQSLFHTLTGTIKYPEDMKKSEDKEPAAAEKSAPAVTNKYGVKVGDIFETSWGYDQTNVNFFQVVKLVGKTSVRVREVYLPMIKEDPTCSMAADRTYKVTREILPAASSSVFIDDQEDGDLKRLKSYAADGVSNPQFTLSSYADAWLVTSDTITEYESWYA